jgi:hypothetical protein
MSIIKTISNKSKDKKYIIPTNEWLKPLKPLNSEDINSRSLIMLSKLVDKEKVVVKLTKNIDHNKINTINNYIKHNPNMLHTFGTFQCSEAEINLESENITIVLEIMNLYDGSLNDYINKFDILEIEELLKQTLLCQLHIYWKIGFVHNDIHLGNFLINKKKEKEKDTLIYQIKNKSYKLETDIKVILSDFDRAVIYNQEILPLESYNNEYTIHSNIIKTINSFKNLLKNHDKEKLSKYLDESLKIFSSGFIHLGEKSLRSYYKKYNDYNYFIRQSISDCIVMLNHFWMLLYGYNLVPGEAL